MWGFVSKEDKKVLQKVRENKDKDVETWKYMIRRESATMVSTMLFLGFATYVLDYAEISKIPLGIGIFASLAWIYGIINFVGMSTILTKLASEDKEKSKEQKGK